MSESVQISDELYDRLESRRREGETMEATLWRLLGRPAQADGSESARTEATGPHPEVAGIISPETAEKIRECIEKENVAGVADRHKLRVRFE